MQSFAAHAYPRASDVAGDAVQDARRAAQRTGVIKRDVCVVTVFASLILHDRPIPGVARVGAVVNILSRCRGDLVPAPTNQILVALD